jgi:hypothetical protein
MTEHSIVLLVGLAVIVTLAVLIYLSTRNQESTQPVRQILDQILAGNRAIERTLEQQRRVLNDAHKRIHAVSKGLEKRPSYLP